MNRDALENLADEAERSPLSFFVRNGHMALLLLIGAVVGGFWSLRQMPVENEPEVKIPVGTVTVIYPGASPADTEKLVTDELEEVLDDLDNVEEITSTTQEGLTFVNIEFEADADLKESIRDLRDKVDEAKTDFPSDAEEPEVEQVRAADRPIVTYTMVGDVPLTTFKEHADELEDQLEAIVGVNKVEISGLPEREMQVLVNIEALEGFELSVADIAQTIARNHRDIPVGRVQTSDLYYQASVKGQFDTPEELEELVVASLQGQNVTLKDVATVREVFGPTSSESELYSRETDASQRAVTFEVFKKVGADLMRIVGNTKDVVNAYQPTLEQAGLAMIITDDESKRTKEDIVKLLNSAWQTVLIIAIILLLALGKREAVIASLSIPILYLISFIVLNQIGSTFNFLTFFALILSLGIVVDTSIVVIEGVHEGMRDFGMSPRRAALASIATFRAPLISGSLTTIAAFLPLGLMTGIMGEYVKHIPITVNITLVASLFTALMILPAIVATFVCCEEDDDKHPFLYHYFERLKEWYTGFIAKTINSKKLRRGWLALMTVLFLMTGVLASVGIIKFNLFASSDVDFFTVTVKAPEGTVLSRTREITEQVEDIVQQLPELVRTVSVYGAGSSHEARINVTISDTDQRKRKSYEIVSDLRSQLKGFTSAEVLVEELETGPPTGADIDMRIMGKDIPLLENYAEEVQKLLRNVPGTEDVRNNLSPSPGEYHLKARHDRLQFFGVDTSTLGSILRTSVFGDSSVKILRGGEETDIVVQLDYRTPQCKGDPITGVLEVRDQVTLCRSHPADIDALLNRSIPTQRGTVLLKELVDVSLQPGITTIRHFGGRRVVNVRATVAEGSTVGEVTREFQEQLASIEKPSGITVGFGGENEETAESMRSMGRASVLALLLIMAILVYQFGSFKQIFIVMATMPLAIMGVLYGLALIRFPLSFPGMIGVVALLGIVVNDAIVLIDRMNVNRKEFGLAVPEAVLAACKQRMEPVIMTTLTTALGVLPLIFSSEVFRDLAIVVAIGITVATVFTLIIIPILYVTFETPRQTKAQTVKQ